MRVSRWRPVCPDCGYSLRGATSDRCPECGVPYPTTARTYRRWAVRRLPWDRLHRGSLLIAYFKSPFSRADHRALRTGYNAKPDARATDL